MALSTLSQLASFVPEFGLKLSFQVRPKLVRLALGIGLAAVTPNRQVSWPK